MTGNSSSGDSNDRILAELFAELDRRGTIAIQEYRARYPHLAGEIDRLVPLHAQMDRSAEVAEPPIPERLGGFRIVRKIDHGGMGEIYEAIQEQLNRRVAIKVIRRGRVSPILRERFLREQEVLARLHQTHIVPIHTADETEGLQYFAMPYIEGATLGHAVSEARRLDETHSGGNTPTLAELACGTGTSFSAANGRSRRWPSRISTIGDSAANAGGTAETTEHPAPAPIEIEVHGPSPACPSPAPVANPPASLMLSMAYFRSVAAIMADAADALQHAHDAGILHRDVKPSNIMVNALGQCCLIDFGLARYVAKSEAAVAGRPNEARDAELPPASGLLGTPNYMAPEQINQQAGKPSDVWGLGATLYELLTLRRAFDGPATPELFRAIQTQDPPPPRQLIRNVPADLAAICGKALRKTPQERYASAGELAEDLRRWLRFEPTRARPARVSRQALLWARRNKGWAAALLAVTLVGLPALAVAYANYADKVLQARTRAEVEIMAIQNGASGRMFAPTQNRRTDMLTALEKTAAPRQLIVPGPIADKLDLDSRSLVAQALACPEFVVSQHEKLKGTPAFPWPLAMHPDGSRMAIGAAKRPLLWRRGQPLMVPEAYGQPIPGSRLTYSPNGKWLVATSASGGIEVWDADLTHTESEWKKDVRLTSLAFGFSADSNQVLVCTATGLVQSLSLPGLTEGSAWTLDKPVKAWTAAGFNRNSTRLAVANTEGSVIVYAPDGTEVSRVKADRQEIEAIAWSPDDRLLAVGSVSGGVRLWDVEHGIPLHSFQLMGANDTYLEFTPDGQWLLASRRQGELLVWNTATGQQVLSGPFYRGSLSADGKWLAASREDDLAFCELVQPESIREFNGHRGLVQQIVWSADGRWLASIDNAFQIQVWRMDAAAPIQSIAAPLGEFYAHRGNAALALSNNGSILAYASGGRDLSHLVLYETATGKELWKGTMPGAFEHLAALGDDRFLLVRDQFGRIAQQYEWKPGAPPQLIKTLREGAPAEAGTQAATLTPDGRYFCWVGPHQPPNAKRVEVWETGTGRVRRFPEPEPDAVLSDNGRYLYLARGVRKVVYDLSGDGLEQPIANLPATVSADAQWLLFMPGSEEFGRRTSLRLNRLGDERPLVEVYDYSDRLSCTPAFSRDGRYFAWGVDRGTVKVADLHTLHQRIDTFEKALLSK